MERRRVENESRKAEQKLAAKEAAEKQQQEKEKAAASRPAERRDTNETARTGGGVQYKKKSGFESNAQYVKKGESSTKANTTVNEGGVAFKKNEEAH